MKLDPISTAIARWYPKGTLPPAVSNTRFTSCRVIVNWPLGNGIEGTYECTAELIADQNSPCGFRFTYYLWNDQHECTPESPELVAWRIEDTV